MDPLFEISDKVYCGLRKQSIANGLIKSFEGSGQIATVDAATGDVLVQDAKSNVTRFGFDARGFIVSVTSPLGRIWTLDNDGNGRMVGLTGPSGLHLGMTYDDKGDISAIQRGKHEPISLSFDAHHRLTRIAYPDGSCREVLYNDRGQATSVKDRLGITELYEYDADGELIAIVDGNGNRTAFQYGEWKRPDTVHYPDGSTESYTYDPSGYVKTISAGSEEVAKIEHNDKGLLTRIVYSDGETLSYVYNDDGKITEAACGGHVVTYEYDEAGRVLREDQNGEIVGYHYDELSSLVGITYPTGERVEFAYDADLRLSSVKDWKCGIHLFSYDKTDRVSTLRSPNGCVTTFRHSESGKLQGTAVVRTTIGGAEEIFYYGCDYDDEDRVVSAKDSQLGTRHFTYDKESQLVGVKDDRSQQTFAYDGAGNRTNCNGETATFTALNQLLAQGQIRCTYDARGNVASLTESTGSWRFVHDSRNLLVSAVNDSGLSVSFRYDAFGRRVWKRVGQSETRYVWAGEQVISQIVFQPVKKLNTDFLYYPGTYTPLAMRREDECYYYHHDHLGTSRRISNEEGEFAWSADYDAFGRAEVVIDAVSNPLRFPGQYYDDETTLLYNRFRYYSSVLGRYLSRDPLTYLAGTNFYSYAGNNYINSADPLGLFGWKDGLVIAVSAAAAVAVGAAVVAMAPALVPLAIVSAGAAAGAVGFGLNQALNEKQFCLKCILKEAGRGALIGAVSALPFAFLPASAGYAAFMGAGGASGAIGYIGDFVSNPAAHWSWGGFATAVGVGMATAGAGKYLSVQFSKHAGIEPGIETNSTVDTASNIENARAFYKDLGWSDAKVEAHLQGIDFSKPVEVVRLSQEQVVEQWVDPQRGVGHYFSEPGTPATDLGIFQGERVRTSFSVSQDVDALESTAASIEDTWSVEGKSFLTKGGAKQYFVKDISVFKRL